MAASAGDRSAALAGQKAAGDIRAVHEVQGRDGNWDYSAYMCGLFNGLELALAITEGRDPAYRERPESGWHCDHGHPALPDGFAADVAGAADPDPASGGPAAGRAVSLGEQPHDPVSCDRDGQPHLGPCVTPLDQEAHDGEH